MDPTAVEMATMEADFEQPFPSEAAITERRPRRVYPAEEHGKVPIPLTELVIGNRLELYPEIIGKGYFRIGLSGDHLEFHAGGFVGLIPINDRVTIDVRPRTPVKNIERLIALSGHRPFSLAPHLRRYARSAVHLPALFDLVAGAFIDALIPIELHGLHRAFNRSEENTSFPRGRILLGETLRRDASRGLQHRATATWFEQTIDTAPNRCLKYALWYLFKRYREMQRRKGTLRQLSDINQAFHIFDGVQLDFSRQFLKDPLVQSPDNLPTNRIYYRDALQLAITIIEQRGVMLRGNGSSVLMASWIVDMTEIFESYIRSVLRERFNDLAPNIRVFDGNQPSPRGAGKLLFDRPPSVMATPDIVIRHEPNEPDGVASFTIVEVKYKRSRTLDREDLEQTIVYASSYRSLVAIVVQPCMPNVGSGLSVVGTINEISLYQYVFDLAANDPEEEEEKFANSIRQLIC